MDLNTRISDLVITCSTMLTNSSSPSSYNFNEVEMTKMIEQHLEDESEWKKEVVAKMRESIEIKED